MGYFWGKISMQIWILEKVTYALLKYLKQDIYYAISVTKMDQKLLFWAF